MEQEITLTSLIINTVFAIGGAVVGFLITLIYNNSIAPDLFVGKRYRLIIGEGKLVYNIQGNYFSDGINKKLMFSSDFHAPSDDDFVSFQFNNIILVVSRNRAKIKGNIILKNKKNDEFEAELFGDGQFDSNSQENSASGVIYFNVKLCTTKPGSQEKVTWNALYIANIDDIYNNGRGYWYTKDRDIPRAFAFGIFRYNSSPIAVKFCDKIKKCLGFKQSPYI